MAEADRLLSLVAAERGDRAAAERMPACAADPVLRIDLVLAEADASADVEVYERIAASAEATEVQRAHAQIELGQAALRAADDCERAARLAELAAAHPNVAPHPTPAPDPAAHVAAAAAHFDRAATLLATALAPRAAEAAAGRATALRRQGDPRRAADLLIEARDGLLAAGQPDPAALLALHVELAVCHSELGDDQEAAAAAGAALDLAGRADPGRLAHLHLETARTLLALGRLGEAAVALAQARQARREEALRPRLAWCHQARGRERGRSGDVVGAVADLVVAYDLFQASGQSARQADTALELAEFFLALGQPIRAAELLDFTPESEQQAARAHRLRALMCEEEVAKEEHFVRSITLFRRTGPRDELAKTVGELADLQTAHGRLDDAAETLRAGVADLQGLQGMRGRSHRNS